MLIVLSKTRIGDIQGDRCRRSEARAPQRSGRIRRSAMTVWRAAPSGESDRASPRHGVPGQLRREHGRAPVRLPLPPVRVRAVPALVPALRRLDVLQGPKPPVLFHDECQSIRAYVVRTCCRHARCVEAPRNCQRSRSLGRRWIPLARSRQGLERRCRLHPTRGSE